MHVLVALGWGEQVHILVIADASQTRCMHGKGRCFQWNTHLVLDAEVRAKPPSAHSVHQKTNSIIPQLHIIVGLLMLLFTRLCAFSCLHVCSRTGYAYFPLSCIVRKCGANPAYVRENIWIFYMYTTLCCILSGTTWIYTRIHACNDHTVVYLVLRIYVYVYTYIIDWINKNACKFVTWTYRRWLEICARKVTCVCGTWIVVILPHKSWFLFLCGTCAWI